MMTTLQIQPQSGIVKKILSGDSVIIWGHVGSPPPETTLFFSNVVAPKLARRASKNLKEIKDEPWAWEAREYLRKKLIGEEVLFTCKKLPNSQKVYGIVYLGKDISTAENITESMVSEGLVSVTYEGVMQTPELAHLQELEDKAKADGKGKWGENTSEHIRDVKWSIEEMRNFVDQQGGKPIKAIIESVRDGSTMQAFLLPDYYYITLMISGIRCPYFKWDDNKGRLDLSEEVPFAKEARYFVETRLLQREVEIMLESINNNNFMGTILHSKVNIAEALLEEGLAKCVNWSMAFMKSGADKFNTAERKAKEASLKIWKDYELNKLEISVNEKEFTGTVTEINGGNALTVRLSNGQTKKIFLSSIKPPCLTERDPNEDRKLNSRSKNNFRSLYDIPWMFEAREYLRKGLIGKEVHVVVDYIQEARDTFPEKICATVTINEINVAQSLVLRGLATVVRYPQDNDQRSSHYDDLLVAEMNAYKSKIGLHSKQEHVIKVIDLVSRCNNKGFLSTFQKIGRMDAIVELVRSGSRFQLFLPKGHYLCNFLLGGVNCPRAARPAMGDTPAIQAEPYGEKALAFTKKKCLQREVSIQIDTVDKAGTFIGGLWIKNISLSEVLIEKGFARLHTHAGRTEYWKELKKAEDTAKRKNLRLWK